MRARRSAVPVTTGFVQDAAFPAGSFDVVTMYHALEHVEDPSAILSRLRDWMVDQGVLLIEVPNVEAVCIAPAHRFHFAHFYHFNRERARRRWDGKRASSRWRPRPRPDGGNLTSVFRVAAARAAAAG